MQGTEELKRTPLFNIYKKYNGKVVEFGGWELPVQFSGILDEHKAVRENAGLFDVSHMGEIEIMGPKAYELVQRLITNDISNCRVGQVIYSPMCYPDGGVVDDVLVYKFSDTRYMMVVNAANIDKDYEWITDRGIGGTAIGNVSAQVAQIALQGPKAFDILKNLTEKDISGLTYYSFIDDVVVCGIKCIVSRTGYTGEDGFELYCDTRYAEKLWECIMESGAEHGLKPCGLGARDVLRFEACMPLYGHELSNRISPLEAGLGRFVKLDKEEFIGKQSLKSQKEKGLERKLVGFKMIDKGIARPEYSVYIGDSKIGTVTSGSFSPSLGQNLGMALIQAESSAIGTEIAVEIREKKCRAEIIERPFYKRK